jgi:hypothetical protein
MIVRKVDNKSFRLKNFRLSLNACSKLGRASKRLGLPEVRIVEELISKYADGLAVEIKADTNENAPN